MEALALLPTRHGAGPSSRAENCRDPEMPRGGEKSPANTRERAHRDVSIKPHPCQLWAFRQEPPRKRTHEVSALYYWA